MTQSVVVALLLLLVCEGATAMQVSRRTALASVASAPVVQLQRPAVAAGPPGEPSEGSVLKARQAFEAFDAKDLDLAERLFTETIAEWRSLGRWQAQPAVIHPRRRRRWLSSPTQTAPPEARRWPCRLSVVSAVAIPNIAEARHRWVWDGRVPKFVQTGLHAEKLCRPVSSLATEHRALSWR